MSPPSHPERRRPPPLDAAKLDRLALRYVERFATTRGKLADYLRRKVRERGWDGPPADPVAVAERMAQLGYIDDLAFAEARARGMARRGLGERRVKVTLRAAGIDAEDAATVAPQVEAAAVESAMTFARRRRLGPFATQPADRAVREKQLAAMLRAGHGLSLARQILETPPGEPFADDLTALVRCDDVEPC
ncbi:regulatory protein [Sphingomonas gellani]|uniref:Regulatory protein RecX n=1 Tax=Sphingomonas gellani TaxID=1166340 RepID=A0A1H8FRR0_9SPHN|nr:RecX family transcriptional regulator [Sphingomonas gellani]SEN34240.1 regulatory protein [Sphingomonas gellani]